MDAVGEEDTLGIDREVLELLAVPVTVIILQDILQDPADPEVVLPILVPVDVPAPFRCLREVIYIFLLLQAEILPAFYAVTDDAQIGKLVYLILECILPGLLPARCERKCRAPCNQCHLD